MLICDLRQWIQLSRHIRSDVLGKINVELTWTRRYSNSACTVALINMG